MDTQITATAVASGITGFVDQAELVFPKPPRKHITTYMQDEDKKWRDSLFQFEDSYLEDKMMTEAYLLSISNLVASISLLKTVSLIVGDESTDPNLIAGFILLRASFEYTALSYWLIEEGIGFESMQRLCQVKAKDLNTQLRVEQQTDIVDQDTTRRTTLSREEGGAADKDGQDRLAKCSEDCKIALKESSYAARNIKGIPTITELGILLIEATYLAPSSSQAAAAAKALYSILSDFAHGSPLEIWHYQQDKEAQGTNLASLSGAARIIASTILFALGHNLTTFPSLQSDATELQECADKIDAIPYEDL